MRYENRKKKEEVQNISVEYLSYIYFHVSHAINYIKSRELCLI